MSLDFDALGLYEHIYIYMNIYEHVLTLEFRGFGLSFTEQADLKRLERLKCHRDVACQ